MGTESALAVLQSSSLCWELSSSNPGDGMGNILLTELLLYLSIADGGGGVDAGYGFSEGTIKIFTETRKLPFLRVG